MAFAKTSVLFSLALLASTAVSEPVSLGKRSGLLESRQIVCSTPGWIPACPGMLLTNSDNYSLFR
jgi:hypothetical protein